MTTRTKELNAEGLLELPRGQLNPQTRTATVYRSLGSIRMLRGQEKLEGEDVVPGWVLPLAEGFEPFAL